MTGDKSLVWSPNRDYNSIQYTFSVENGKVVVVDKKRKTLFNYLSKG